jgi:DNA-binding NarL/FixJ family response regulator
MCVDDHPVIREGLTGRIAIECDMSVVAAASTGEEALDLFDAHQPDITLMDLNLPGMSGVDTIMSLRQRHPHALIIALTMHMGDEDIHRALTAGAVAYVPKTAVSDSLLEIIRAVYGGARPMSAEVASALAVRVVTPSLTPREKDVLQLIGDGLKNTEVAASLDITENTVEIHLKKIFRKLRVHDRTAAVTVALRRGILHLSARPPRKR